MIKEIKIKLSEKEYIIKKNYKSLLEFENQTDRGITEMKQTLADLLMLFYCILISNNESDLTFSQFVDLIDENENVLDDFNNYLVNSATTIDETVEKKKKVKALK